jgi:hypothetical protein
MNDDLKKIDPPQLTDEEIKIIKQMVEGQKAMRWLKTRSVAIAAWFTAIIGAWLAVTGQLKQWLQSMVQGG